MKNDVELRKSIVEALAACATGQLRPAAMGLLRALGYESDRTQGMESSSAEGFRAVFAREGPWNEARAMTGEWRTIDFLFQLTGEDVNRAQAALPGFESEAELTNESSFLFFAVDLQRDGYRRSDLAGMTREINRPFLMPAIVLFRHGDSLTLSVIERRTHKRDADRDVLEKVTLIKDIRCRDPHRAHVDILSKLALAKSRARSWPELRTEWRNTLDVEPLTQSFLTEYRKAFAAFEKHVSLCVGSSEQSRLFAQRTLNRFMFCWFLQRKGWLNGQQDYLRGLYEIAEAHTHSRGHGQRYPNYYRDYLWPLFFCALNTPWDSRPSDADWSRLSSVLGTVPYLNGGLFAPEEPLDVRDAVRLPNSAFEPVLSLFENYHFTVAENTPLDVEVAVDPEMLGMVFEKLISDRHEKGSYYTPRVIVSFMCREALKGYLGGHEALVDGRSAEQISVPEARRLLDRLADIRVVDPACGSGAYLLGMLHELNDLTRLLDTRAETDARNDYQRKLQIICNSIYGVDLDQFAVNIARLRLWLSLVVEYDGANPPPLPNLDLKIECGDSLAAPDPSARDKRDVFRDVDVTAYKRAKDDYTLEYDGVRKREIMREVQRLRAAIAKRVHINEDVAGFDWEVEFAEVFDHGGFDVVLANPPYGEGSVTDALRDAYFGPRSGQSKDIYAAFLVRGLQLLRPGGMLAYITSNTWRTLRTHRPLRKRLLQHASVLHFIDVPEWVFRAVVRTCILTARRVESVPSDHTLIAADLAALPDRDWEMLERNLSAIARRGPDLQTLAFARYTYPQSLIHGDKNFAFFIAMPSLQRFFRDPKYPRLGEGPNAVAKIAVGLQTGDNEYYIRVRGKQKGGYRAVDPALVLSDEELAEFAARPAEERLKGIDPQEFGGRHFVPYDKGADSDLEAGGWLPCYRVPTEYYLDWSRGAVNRLRTATIADCKRRRGETPKPGDDRKVASRFQNAELYFQPGITFSRTGRYAPTFRLASGGVFDTEGSLVAPLRCNPLPLLGVLNSRLVMLLVKAFLDSGWHAQVDELKMIPVPESVGTSERLSLLVRQLVAEQANDPRYPYWSAQGPAIETEVAFLYGLSPEEVRDVDLWYCRFERGRLARARGDIERVAAAYADYLSKCDARPAAQA